MDAAGPTNTAATEPAASGCPVDHHALAAAQATAAQVTAAQAIADQAAAGGCPVDHEALAAAAATVPVRSAADRRMRKLLLLEPDAPRVSIFGSEQLFGRSIAISAVRCLLTYVFLPLLAPIVNLSGIYGPILGLVLGAVSMIAIVFSMRRFFAADHKWRWGYAIFGGAVLVWLVIQTAFDVASLVG